MSAAMMMLPDISPAPQEQGARAKSDSPNMNVTYGRVKEINEGKKVVIDVDNAPDKSFDLGDKDVSVNMDRGLKVGDPVKVSESKTTLGKTKAVTIHKDTNPNVKHGDKDPHKP